MKMVKKSLLGLVVAAMVLSLTGCGVKDDPEGIIKGTAGNYSVNYTYENQDTTATYRAYKSTGFRHAGALVKFTFNKDDIANAGNSKLGLIFGLKETKNGDQKIRNFYIIGLGANGDYYVSKYENVVDIQAENFGASTSALGTDPKETILVDITSSSLYTDADQNKYAYIWYQAYNDGSFQWKIMNMTDEEVNNWKQQDDAGKRANQPVASASINGDIITGAFGACDAGKEPQDYIAVYARVQGSKTLNGKINFKGDYREAEDIEMID